MQPSGENPERDLYLTSKENRNGLKFSTGGVLFELTEKGNRKDSQTESLTPGLPANLKIPITILWQYVIGGSGELVCSGLAGKSK